MLKAKEVCGQTKDMLLQQNRRVQETGSLNWSSNKGWASRCYVMGKLLGSL